ncbi:hypothetical protein B0H15DRAFT_789135 [Mycena belliarum]|uniref:DUF4100 domain-containing protein n=1 Tax=Mycena belliarum TaxID=1033014 RepID=A0AAD6XKU5_9AGAR|nr:hypothetical protein B0H15DRAFT_789135 [Mycena belliae]
MPIPRTPNAPYFNGKYLSDFLTVLIQHGANAGITDLDLLVPYILQYSSDEVKDLIRYLPEFDPDESGKTFKKAKESLQLLYGQADEPPNYTESMLREFCREQSAKSSFKDKKHIETYHKEFMQIAGPLVKRSKITSKQRDYYFVSGIPSVIKEWFNNQVPEPNRKRTDPPSIAVSIGILQKRFDVDSLLFEPWKDETEPRDRKVKFDTDGKRVDSTSQKSRPATPIPASASQAPAAATNSVGDLARLLENLSLHLAVMKSKNQTPAPSGASGSGAADTSADYMRRCFLCAKTGTHPLHPSRCPEAKSLIEAGLIKMDPTTRRLVMPDGADLPRIPYGFVGGVADFIRAEAREKAQTTAHTHTMGLSYGNEPVLKGDVFAVSSIGYSDYYADPVTRSGKDTNRFDPTRKPDAKGKGKQVERDRPPHLPPKQPTPGPSHEPQPREAPIPPPAHPVNRPDGWKGSLPSNSKPRDDVAMKDVQKKTDKPSYHFTSDIQELAGHG